MEVEVTVATPLTNAEPYSYHHFIMMRLALLICDTPIPTVKEAYGTYLDIFRSWLTNSAAVNAPDIEFTLEGYDVVQGIYPKDEDFVGEGAFKGVVLTGSGSSSSQSR